MQYQPWVRKVVTEVSTVFNLQDWTIGLIFDASYPNNDEDTVCYIIADSDYFKARIFFTPYAKDMWNDGKFDQLSDCIVHELVHILTDPIYKVAKSASSEITFPFLTTKNEQTTQKITRIVMELLPKKIFSRK